MIVDDDADDVGQHVAALGASAIESHQGGGGDVQPLQFAADAEAGLVHMFDRRGGDAIAQLRCEVAQPRGAGSAHVADRAGAEFHAEDDGHQFDEPVLGKQLIGLQIDHASRDPRTILHGRLDLLGKRLPRRRAAGRASAGIGAVLGDDQRLRLGQVEDLARGVIGRHVGPERLAASRTNLRAMIDDHVGVGDLQQRFALVAGLSARLLSRTFAQAARPSRRLLLQSVARRRLGAVRTVQSEPPLEFGDPRLQSRDLARLRPNQRNKFFFPRRLDRRFARHPILKSEPDSAVERNLARRPKNQIEISLPGQLREFYHHCRPHQAMDNQRTRAVRRQGVERADEPAEAADMQLRLDNANALPTYPQQRRKKQKKAV